MSTVSENEVKATALFEELGKLTPEAIRDRVKAAGIVGERGNTTKCPLALLVRKELGLAVTIGGSYWSFPYGDGATHTLPESCQAFIRRVDDRDPAFDSVAVDAPEYEPYPY